MKPAPEIKDATVEKGKTLTQYTVTCQLPDRRRVMQAASEFGEVIGTWTLPYQSRNPTHAVCIISVLEDSNGSHA